MGGVGVVGVMGAVGVVGAVGAVGMMGGITKNFGKGTSRTGKKLWQSVAMQK